MRAESELGEFGQMNTFDFRGAEQRQPGLKLSRIDVIGQNGNDGAAYEGRMCGECWIERGTTDCSCEVALAGVCAGPQAVRDGGREAGSCAGAEGGAADMAEGESCLSESVLVIVEGEPVGKGRPKAVRQGGFVRMYTPEKTRSYEEKIADEARKSMSGRDPITGPVLLELSMVVSVPSSWSKKKRAAALSGQMVPTKKPDKDNVIKAICDSLNGIVWVDDVQVTDLVSRKRFGEHPHVQAVITPLALLGSS